MYKVKRFSFSSSLEYDYSKDPSRRDSFNLGDYKVSTPSLLASSAVISLPTLMSKNNGKTVGLAMSSIPLYYLASHKYLKKKNEEFDKDHPGELSESEKYERRNPKGSIKGAIGYLTSLGGVAGGSDLYGYYKKSKLAKKATDLVDKELLRMSASSHKSKAIGFGLGAGLTSSAIYYLDKKKRKELGIE